MRKHSHFGSAATLLGAVLLALPLVARAQDTNDMAGMDHSKMDHSKMDHSKTDPSKMGHSNMDHSTVGTDGAQNSAPAWPAMDHSAMHGSSSNAVPPNARSPDYSDGIEYLPMHGMDMLDDASLGMLRVDRLEAFLGSDANGQAWELGAWYGNDMNKLWLRSEGERSGGHVAHADVEAFWNHTATAFFDTQLGVRHDFGDGPSRTWAAVGVEGLAPYWLEVAATAYVGSSGRTAVRLRADYDLLLTQRLIVQPSAEINFYGKNDPARRIGSGLSDVQFGVRLRYEVDRQFAPYVGIEWVRRIGTTADYAREDFQPVVGRQIVAGVRLWL